MRLHETLPWMLAGLIISVAGLSSSTATATTTTRLLDNDPARYVNPFVGTDNYAYTFPGAAAPFGMCSGAPIPPTGHPAATSTMTRRLKGSA